MYNEVLGFWFEEIEQSAWWVKDEEFDTLIKSRFGVLHRQAQANELFAWRETAKGSLAEVIILDQFSRNIYRDTAQSFACDSQALTLAQFAIDKGLDKQLSDMERSFLYIPFMHSESLVIHEEAVKLYDELGDAKTIEFEHKHKVIIEQFGRYPHRNQILGRTSTPEEIAFLDQPGSSF